MSNALQSRPRDSHDDRPAAIEPIDRASRRPVWRRWLIDAERGLSLGMRTNSIFFVHFFGVCLVLAAATVLGLELMQWTMLILSLTVTLTAEMFNTMIRSILESAGHHVRQSARNALRIGSAAVFVALVGASACMILVFAERVMVLFAGA